jgi:anti-anti-sigma factor
MITVIGAARNTRRGEAAKNRLGHSAPVELEEAVRLRVPYTALDLATVDDFRRWVSERTPAAAGVGVVLDLADVELVMAAGVQALLDVDTELAAGGRTLGVVEASPVVRRVLDICGFAECWLVRA